MENIIDKLKYRLFTVVAVVFIFQMLATKFYWYDLLWYFDMPMHYMGGLFIGLLAFYLYLKAKKNVPLDLNRTILFVVIFSIIIAVGWEVFEYVVAITTRGSVLHLLDSVSDIFFDLAGASTAVIYTLFKINNIEVLK